MAVASVESSTENLYEGLFLLGSADFAANPDGTAQVVLDILEKAGASVCVNRPWQDGRLAYPIKGHRKGLHYLTYFRMPGSGVAQVTRACKLSDTVIRHMLIKHPTKLFEALVAASSPAENAAEGERDAESVPDKNKKDKENNTDKQEESKDSAGAKKDEDLS